MASSSSSSLSHATAEDVLRLLTGRRIIPSVEAGIVLIASMSQVVRDTMLRVRIGPGGVPLPDKGSEVCLAHTVLFQRLPPQPAASAASGYHADVQFDAAWLETYGLRQSRRSPKAPASVRRTDLSGREAHDTLGRLFSSAEHVRRSLAAVFDAAAEIATGVCGMATRGDASKAPHPPRRVSVTFPGLGTLLVDRTTADFAFSSEVVEEALAVAERSQPRRRGGRATQSPTSRWAAGGRGYGDDDDGRLSVASSSFSRPASACGSAASLARSLSRCSSSAGGGGAGHRRRQAGDLHAADEEVLSGMFLPHTASEERQRGRAAGHHRAGSSASIASIGSRSRPTSSAFRRPNSTALQRAMDAAVEKELAAKRDKLDSERRFASRSMQRADLAAVVDVAERKKKAGERSIVLEHLARQIEERRARNAADQSERRAPTPVVFPFSDQEGMADRTRRLAQEQCSVNEAFAERHRAQSRNESRREWEVNAESAARSRSDAAREFLDAAAAKRQQREELQDAWRAQIALKYAVGDE